MFFEMEEKGFVYHQPVMVLEVVNILTKEGTRGGLFVDATVGGGGHAEALLQSRSDIRLICLDQDLEAVQTVSRRLETFGDRFKVIHANFRRLAEFLCGEQVAGVVMDLGISSYQLGSTSGRGFSFQHNEPLDMRMDPQGTQTAAEIVNEWSEEELARIFWESGEMRFARRIARLMVETRKYQTIRTTMELADLVIRAVKHKEGKGRIHPATRIFQALRIEVNDELGALNIGLDSAWGALEKEGRLAVISFHSLEDRMVKNRFRQWALEEKKGERLNKKPRRPTEDEIKNNSRSRSAKLRAIEKL